MRLNSVTLRKLKELRLISSFTFFLIAILCGCKKFVQIPPPTNQLVTSSVFANSGSATSAVLAIYQQMQTQQESFLMAQYNGLLADEFRSFSANSGLIQFYKNALLASNNPGRWTTAYNYIYQANAVIAGLQVSKGVSIPVQNQLLGESKFIRAFWAFYLTSMYGDIPIVTSTDYTINANLGRAAQSQVYTQIIADLQDAKVLLNSQYINASDTLATTERVRPTKWAACSLLARVYLFAGKYDSAENEATTVINNSALYSLCSNLDNVFLKNSTEAIWQLMLPLPSSNVSTPDGIGFVLISAPSNGTTRCTSISDKLYNSFETGDLRKTHWIGSYQTTSSPSTIYYYPNKYKGSVSNKSTNVSEYVMVLRLSEQFLIRAEARTQRSNLSGADSDLNAIRNRAGLADTTLTSKTDMLSAILHERQVELFSEWGHRWFDLVRTGSADSVMGAPGYYCQTKGGSWSSNCQLYPIPQGDRSADQHLTQNSGY